MNRGEETDLSETSKVVFISFTGEKSTYSSIQTKTQRAAKGLKKSSPR